ncbi:MULTISPECIES: VOC family protein [unclassified Pseudomonas]|jgi:3,4-dihydroxy-9,10-secoandrosta-1,3,5(10)-triene-9,17-dione 4,5-dioxygenase|uniref:VOC family protein n=1 Tax=unclassified Pseudomonas TaxID=196821 RepID=UPI001CBAE4DA|nr:MULTISPECIES: VOC family protein [unclassified Pseudomonas]
MSINQFAYAVVESTDIEKWRFFGSQIIGLAEESGEDGALYLKADGRRYRILVVPGARDGLYAAGWETASEEQYLASRESLVSAGVEIVESTPLDRHLRCVTGMFSFVDPSGNRQEVTWGPISDFAPFVSPVGVERFVTGPMGMGHVVLPSMKFEETKQFWTDVCGFQLSDMLHVQLSPEYRARIHFLHCNPRQHSLALAEMPQPSGCVHIMMEVPGLDDVGRALDRIARHKVPLAATLGRHVNDDMVSFYVWTPGGFALEFGCGGMVVDWENDHTVFETTRGSHWGHQWAAPPAS